MRARQEWSRVSVKDVCERIIDCINKTAPTVDYVTPYKMIRTTNVRDGWISLDDVKFVTGEVFERWNRRATPKAGDVILTREAPLGEVGMLRGEHHVFLGQRLVLYRADPRKLDNRFLLYAFRTDFVRGQVLSYGSGSTVEHMRVPDCEKIELLVPSLGYQRRVADILSAYDDLIENNTRRIRILEEMAQRLYREWFVHFRFPGHENVRMVESELGLIPEGWRPQRVTESVLVNPLTRVLREGEKPFVPMGSLSESSMLISDIETRTGNSGSKFMNGDTLFARITPCLENGKTGFVQFLPSDRSVAFGSTEFIVLRSKTLCPEYVYLMARTEEFRNNAIKSMSGATGRQRVQQACFNRFHIAQPDDATLEQFQNTVGPMFRMVSLLAAKNANLRATRDLLLPKLISGEISVEVAAEAAAEAMEATA